MTFHRRAVVLNQQPQNHWRFQCCCRPKILIIVVSVAIFCTMWTKRYILCLYVSLQLGYFTKGRVACEMIGACTLPNIA